MKNKNDEAPLTDEDLQRLSDMLWKMNPEQLAGIAAVMLDLAHRRIDERNKRRSERQ